MQDSMTPQTFDAPRPSRSLGNLAIFSAIALVLVILSSALLLRSHTQPQTGAKLLQSPTTTVRLTTCQSSALGCATKPGLVGTIAPSSDQGIVMQVTYAHLDAVETTILVTLTSDALTLGATLIDDGIVTDTDGHVLSPILSGNGGHILSPHKIVAIYLLLPLSDTQLRQPQHLIFTAHHITTNLGKPLPGNNGAIIGSWRNTFTVNPALGTEYQIQTAPVTIQGVSFRVDSLEVAPFSAQDGDIPESGGVRIMLTATHVPADTLRESFAAWYATTVPRLRSCPSNGCPPRPGPTSAVLTLPGFVPGQALNSISFVVTPSAQSTPETVGSTQTVQIALLYPGSGTLSGANAMVTVTNFHLFTSITPTADDLKQTPAWQLPIPLHG